MKATSDPSPPVLQAEKDPNALDAVYCRPPQPLPGMHLMGPKICKPNSFWTELHGQGLDLSADGRNTVPSEKYRSLHGEGSIAMPGPAN
jgi:hypothetical protein